MELIKGVKGLLSARVGMPLPLCKYLLTSLHVIASVASLWCSSVCPGCWHTHLVQCIFTIKCNWARTWLGICLCRPQLSQSLGSLLTGKCLVLVSTRFGGLASKYKCPEEGVWWQQTQYQGPWHCWLFRLQAFPQHRRHSQHEAPGGWQAHLRLNLAAGVQTGVLVGIGTGGGQGFGWLLPGHPGFSSNSKSIWPWMPTTGSHSSVPTLKCRLPSTLSRAIKTRGTRLQRSLPTAVYLFFSLGQRLCRASSVRPLLPPPPPVRTAARHPRVISHFKGS